ncbi:MAG TPA: hypothetical protein VM888_02675 [Chitinophagaceae bacterium]|nr:hypothetical protein [Chitinophagaceae bacterium]
MFKAWGIYIFVTALVFGVAKMVYGINVWYFTKDPNALNKEGDFYFGAFSNLGVIFWTIAATLCFFGTFYLKRYNPGSPLRSFLLHGGIFTTILLLDDLYMWHEQMFPVYFGISAHFVYATYLAYGIFFIVRFRKEIFKTEYLILLASAFLISLSVLVDVLHDSSRLYVFFLKITGMPQGLLDEMAVLLEETAKGMGILTWLIYFSRVLFKNVLPAKDNGNIETSKRKTISAPLSQIKSFHVDTLHTTRKT